MYLAIVFLPLLGSMIAGFFGRAIGREGSMGISIFCVSLSTLFSFIAFYEVGLSGSPCYINAMTWINSELLYISWGFLFDSLTVVMLIVVTVVSTLVHIYSTSYMSHDPHICRFMSYLSLFTFFMLILITADNFVQMFVGWEGVGLCSYLLINFWFTRIQANKAAMKAMIVNRIGDFGLSLGMMAIFFVFKTLDFETVFSTAPLYANTSFTIFGMEFDKLTIICLLLFIGAIGKSAQLGLHTWLPDAMEGPTPVSALIHAATMVTAGVFLLIRCSPIFEYAPVALVVVTIIGAITAFFAATTGLLQNDLKRVIAYSTCSQLGYMVFACGISNYSVSVFHLMNHAFFKALLFLSAGSVIHALSDEQDMRRMGGLRQLLPFTYTMILIGSLSLMGFPFLTGFYSKDVILELAYAKYSISGNFAHWLGVVSAFFTAFYSFRLIYLTFISDTAVPKAFFKKVHDAPFLMAFPLMILAFGSIFIGYLTKDMIIGLGTDFWGTAIYTAPFNYTYMEAEFIPHTVKLIPVIFSLIGASLALYSYHFMSTLLYKIKCTFIGRRVYTFLNKKWYFDNIYNEFIVRNILAFGYHISFKLLDRGFINLFGPQGIGHLLTNVSLSMSKFQTGFVFHYAFIMLIGATFLALLITAWDVLILETDTRLYIFYVLSILFYNYYYNDFNRHIV